MQVIAEHAAHFDLSISLTLTCLLWGACSDLLSLLRAQQSVHANDLQTPASFEVEVCVMEVGLKGGGEGRVHTRQRKGMGLQVTS